VRVGISQKGALSPLTKINKYPTIVGPSPVLPLLFEQGRIARVALVTGAAQGIGRAIAIHLAKDGLDVALDDIESKKEQLDSAVNEIESLGRKAIALTEDVTKEDQVKQMIEKTVAAFGQLDVMIANAGIAPKEAKTLAEADISAWDRLWAVNLRGVVLCYKYAAQQMIKQGFGGRIIGIVTSILRSLQHSILV